MSAGRSVDDDSVELDLAVSNQASPFSDVDWRVGTLSFGRLPVELAQLRIVVRVRSIERAGAETFPVTAVARVAARLPVLHLVAANRPGVFDLVPRTRAVGEEGSTSASAFFIGDQLKLTRACIGNSGVSGTGQHQRE